MRALIALAAWIALCVFTPDSSAFAADLSMTCQMVKHDSDGATLHFNTEYIFDFTSGDVTSIEYWAGGPHQPFTHKYVYIDQTQIVLYKDFEEHYENVGDYIVNGSIIRSNGLVRIERTTKNGPYSTITTGTCRKE